MQDSQNVFKRDSDDSASKELFIHNVGDVSEDSLSSHFKKYGNVQQVRIVKDRETGRPRGFAFVTFDSADEARLAVDDGSEAEVSNMRHCC